MESSKIVLNFPEFLIFKKYTYLQSCKVLAKVTGKYVKHIYKYKHSAQYTGKKLRIR